MPFFKTAILAAIMMPLYLYGGDRAGQRGNSVCKTLVSKGSLGFLSIVGPEHDDDAKQQGP